MTTGATGTGGEVRARKKKGAEEDEVAGGQEKGQEKGHTGKQNKDSTRDAEGAKEGGRQAQGESKTGKTGEEGEKATKGREESRGGRKGSGSKQEGTQTKYGNQMEEEDEAERKIPPYRIFQTPDEAEWASQKAFGHGNGGGVVQSN